MAGMKIAILSMSSIKPDDATDMKNEQAGLKRLLASTEKYGYDHHMLYEKTNFGGQMPVVVEWCKKHKDQYTHVLYTDAFDTLALAGMDELRAKLPQGILFFGSAEKHVFPPSAERAARYPHNSSEWRFVNAGQWFGSIEWFLQMAELVPPAGINDQTWLAERFLDCLEKRIPVTLDYTCSVFQSVAFERSGDYAFTRDGRLYNRKTQQLPIFAHDNGNKHDPLFWLYKAIDEQCGWENDGMRKNHPASETMQAIAAAGAR